MRQYRDGGRCFGRVGKLACPRRGKSARRLYSPRELLHDHAMNLQQILGTELPLIQAPMAGVQGSALAIAVSNAGGLGSLPCAMLAPDAMRKELEAIRAQTDKPYNVNFFCHVQPQPDAQREAAW